MKTSYIYLILLGLFSIVALGQSRVDTLDAVDILTEMQHQSFSPPLEGPSLKFQTTSIYGSFIPSGDSCRWTTLILKEVDVTNVENSDSVTYSLWYVHIDTLQNSVSLIDSSTVLSTSKGWGHKVEHHISLLSLPMRQPQTSSKISGYVVLAREPVHIEGGFIKSRIHGIHIHPKSWALQSPVSQITGMYTCLDYRLER